MSAMEVTGLMSSNRTIQSVTSSTIDTQAFRRSMGLFASGVVVVAAVDAEGNPMGMTCQSFCSLSLQPSLVMFCPGTLSTSYPGIRAAGALCINVLSTAQADISTQFSRSGTDKWAGIDWAPGDNGAPHIEGALLWCEGEIVEEYAGGDHLIVVVGVSRLEAGGPQAGEPLVFHAGRYAAVEYLETRSAR